MTSTAQPVALRRIAPSREATGQRARARVVGIVGGVGCGKSTLVDAVAELVAERRVAGSTVDVLVVDGDAVGHEVRDLPEVREQLVERFGRDILDEDGSVDRFAVAQRVFAADDGGRADLAWLNATMHPVMREEFTRRMEATAADLVLFDAAILLETGWDDLCHEIVFLDVDESDRLARVQERGWDEATWRQREASQWPLEKKSAHATLLADGSLPPETVAADLLTLIGLTD